MTEYDWHVVIELIECLACGVQIAVVIDDFEKDTKGARCENSSLRRMKSKWCLPKKDPKNHVLPPGAVACSLAPGHHQARIHKILKTDPRDHGLN